MKSASKLLYAIGFVFNIIGLVIIALFITLCGVALGSAEIVAKVAEESQHSVELTQQVLLTFVIVLSVVFVIHFIILFMVANAKKHLDNKTGKVSPHLVLLLLGILDCNLFYLLGGIFGMVAASDDVLSE